MNLLFRVIRFLAGLAFRIALWLIALLIRLLLPVVLWVLRQLHSLLLTTLKATVNGPRQYTDRLASEWTRQLLDLGVPRDNLDETYILCRFLARSMIVFGWVVSVAITVEILRIVFGFFF